MADIQSLNAERANRAGDSRQVTPLDLLIDAEHDVRTGAVQPTKALIILLDDAGDSYHFRRYNAGMKASEVVALLEVVKHRLMHVIAED